jgi:hypothetical protein
MNTLCGITIVKDAVKYDYCIVECINSMLPICDKVICVYVESEDNTLQLLKSIQSNKLKIIELPKEAWETVQGKERLSYITNVALQDADRLGFTYSLYVQADEVLHENSYGHILSAINTNIEAFLINRVNLWGTPYTKLNVEQHRQPCNEYVIRLAKVKYRTYDDAENIDAFATSEYGNLIRIYHMGFVRKKEVMKSKIINMQCNVFGMADYDKKLDEKEIFTPELWFDNEKDLIPISEPLPKFIQEWAMQRN